MLKAGPPGRAVFCAGGGKNMEGSGWAGEGVDTTGEETRKSLL